MWAVEIRGFAETPEDPGDRCGGVTLSQTQQSQTRLHFLPVPARSSVGGVRLGERAAQTVQFTLFVQGHSHRGLTGRIRQSLQGEAGEVHRLGPVALELQHLGAVDEALSPERHEAGLIVAPTAECLCPLLRPLQMICAVTGLDDRAVHQAGDDG